MQTIRNSNPNWKYEGVAYRAFTEKAQGTTALYRFYSKGYRGHFFTVDAAEAKSVKKNSNWKYEGVAFYVYPQAVDGAVPVHRFWSKRYRHHFYTTSETEKDDLAGHNPNWNYEGVAFYALAPLNANAKAVPAAAAAVRDDPAARTSGEPADAAWTLSAANGTAVAVPGLTEIGDFLWETRLDAPDSDELAGTGPAALDPEPVRLELKLQLPDGPFAATSWSAADGTVDEGWFEDAFDFRLPVSGVWHWLRIRDETGDEPFSVWIKADENGLP